MRHRKTGRKLGRNSSHRRAMFRNMAAALILHEEIDTTQAKAKELRGIVEKLITQASKAQDSIGKDQEKLTQDEKLKQFHLKKMVTKFLPQKYDDGLEESGSVDLVAKLFDELVPRYKDRPGGYTRVTRIGTRKGDCAPLARIQLV
ncbi:MAG: 50S ribosomal protein L17 [Deltaproteobacteria bacterium]|nr:50S ribosomal protein L17 [Deltaproteobacteria bacterium]MBN2673254.1 50S ribosomal protein L17 [Deltaproteobacteria bacterium]